jgi:aryl-alcohol dehydrogenase-like predicted oxidoreductase
VRYRQLGDSDLEVSEVSLGSWLTYGGGVARDNARACVDRAFELGINFIDTANVYAHGGAEEFLGEALASRPRESYVLATKLYFPMDDENRGLSREQVLKQVDLSFARLRVDYVDLYQCHRYDRETPLEETMGALTEVVRAGKARYLGFSEWTAPQIRAALDMVPVQADVPLPLERVGRGAHTDERAVPARPETAPPSRRLIEKFVSSQPQYSILWRVPEAEVIPLCRDNGISQIVWSPLAQGVLTGKYKPGAPPPDDSRMASQGMGWAMDRFRSEDLLAAVQRLQPIADGLGITMAQLALAWALRESNVACAIIGASRPEQVEDNAAASGIELDDATLAAIDEAVGEFAVHGPRQSG